jgi:excisionase family DNA binding protein
MSIQKPQVTKLLLRPEEVAEALGISKSKAYQMIRSGELPSVVLTGGRLVRVPAVALTAKFAPTAIAEAATK